jgi:anion-transporting  ArsA/GET3 family ATPase
VTAILDRRLIFVTGKGGVGKSTVASALGLLAARSGRRTIVAELSSQDRVPRTFDPGAADSSGQFREIELAPGLFTISIDPHHAMEEYLRIKTGPLGHALASSRLFGAFAMATPGMRELLSMGKVWELAQLDRRSHGATTYDLVIVDAPASGHGVAALRTPRTFAEIARVGPIAHQGRTIAATIADRDFTAVVVVSTAEDMPVNETLALRDALEREQLEIDAVIVNALYPARFEDGQVAALRAAVQRGSSPLARAALTAALSEHARAAAQREQQARLADGLRMPLTPLPYLFTDSFGRAELELLANALAAGLS